MKKGVLEEAIGLVNGDRARLYGGDSDRTGRLYEMIAVSWSAKLGISIQSRDVPLLLADMKVCREMCFQNRDNRIDVAGYMAVVDLIDAPTRNLDVAHTGQEDGYTEVDPADLTSKPFLEDGVVTHHGEAVGYHATPGQLDELRAAEQGQ